MKSVGTKLTFWIVVFPIILIVALFAGVIYLYLPSFDVAIILQATAILSSFVLADFYIWEKLRKFLSKKLEYIHENHLSELYGEFKSDIFHFWKSKVEGIKLDLKRYGKFIYISLYPRNLLNDIDRFLISYEEFDNRLKKIDDIGKKHFEKGMFDPYLWHHVLGIRILNGSYLQSHLGTPQFKLHLEKADFLQEHTKLLKETKEHLKEAEKMKKEILEKLEDFLKSNNLELPERYYHSTM